VDLNLLNQLEAGYLEDNSNNHHKIPRVVVSLEAKWHQEVVVSLVVRRHQEVAAFSVV